MAATWDGWQDLGLIGMTAILLISCICQRDTYFWLRVLGIAVFGGLFTWGCASAPPPPPVIVQAAPTPAPTPIPPDPYAALSPDVVNAIKTNNLQTFHHGITWVQPYSPDLQYPLHCMPRHTTEIQLRQDEWTDKNSVKIGDSDRWGTIVGDHSVLVFPKGSNVPMTVPGAQITIPADPEMLTNLIITTSLGNTYTFNPVDLKKPYTERYQFYYPDLIRQQDAERKRIMQQEGKPQ